ncbi:MAG: D-tyrosyl-tRNA(Tyr) deacylase [Opitutaceae bacterium]|nr:D-tyrosyl-tRNA(Tyr) deacylase [Cytophagales bacterium]
MVAVIQRVRKASVTIDNEQFSSIANGLLVLLGVCVSDSEEDVKWMVQKIANLRIFSDSEMKMNLSVKDINGEILVVSQFTLLANTKKGNRPSFTEAAKPNLAIPLYELFISRMQTHLNNEIKTGKFGADMKVDLQNDGPVTIILDSKQNSDEGS